MIQLIMITIVATIVARL